MSLGSAVPSALPFSTPKRSACDRCRSQKLRCPPRGHSAEPCARCTRLGARCVMSSHSAVGRNNKTPIQQRPKPALRPKGMADTRSVPETSSETAMADPMGTTHDTSPFLIPDDNLDVFSSRSIGPTEHLFTDAMMFRDRSHSDANDDDMGVNISDLLYPDRDNYSPLHSPPVVSMGSTLSIGSAASGSRSGINSGIDSAAADSPRIREQKSGYFGPNEDLSLVLGWDHRLSNLCLNLSRRFHQCQAVLCSRQDRNSPETHSDCDIGMTTAALQQQEMSWSPKLFGDALSDVSEFLLIIQSYRSLPQENATEGARLGIIVMLNLLSAYLQIIAIYNKLLQCLCSQLFGSASSSSSCCSSPSPAYSSTSILDHGEARLQTLPGLQLAGFAIRQGNLQTKIIVDAMLHYFASVERLLGLPAELCVTDKSRRNTSYSRQDTGGGLFESDEHIRGLLAALINSGNGNSTGKSFQMATTGGEHCWLSALSSLQAMIGRVQVFLDS